MMEPRVVRPCGHVEQLVAVQIHKGELLPPQLRRRAHSRRELGTCPVGAPAPPDHNAANVQISKRFCSSAHQHRIRIYLNASDVLDKVRLEQDRLAADFNPNIRSTLVSESVRPSQYLTAEMIATRDRAGRRS